MVYNQDIMRLSKAIISFVSVWLLVFLGVFLRLAKADTFPVDNNDDGLFYVWTGSSFLDNPFSPVSHSIFEKENKSLIWRSQFKDYLPVERFGMKIVRPWFDHPPLGTVIVSLPARILGYKNLEPIPHLLVRYPALVASIFTLFLTYLLAKKLFGEKTALLSLLAFATIPYFVIAHRQSFLENFLTPLFLACLLFLLDFQEKRSKNTFVFLLLFSFLAGWIKVAGFAVPFMIAGWLFFKKMVKSGFAFVFIGFASIASYFFYGLAADSQIFLKALLNQTGRGAFASSFFFGLTRPEFYGQFNDGFYVLGFLFCFFLILVKHKEEKVKFFGWFFIGWLLVLFLLCGRFSNSPWYRYPLLPFMAIAIGYYLKKLLVKNNIFWVAPLFLLGLTGLDLLDINLSSTFLRLLTVGFFSVFLFKFLFSGGVFDRPAFWLTRVFIVFFVVVYILVCLRYGTIHCKKEKCLLPEKIILREN